MKTVERKKKAVSFRSESQRFIIQIRKRLGLSQSGLAKKMTFECDQSTISNWESGKNEIPLSRFFDIMMIAGKDPSDFLSLKNEDKDVTDEESKEVEQ